YLYVLASLEYPISSADQMWYRLLHYRYGIPARDLHILSKSAKKDCIQGVVMGSSPSAGISSGSRTKMLRLAEKIEELRVCTNKALPDLLLDIYELSGLSREFTRDTGDEDLGKDKAGLRNLKALYDLACNFQHFHGTDLQGFIEYIGIADEVGEDLEPPQYNGEKGVILRTCHSAKGLEYRHVYVIDLSKGRFPIAGGGREPMVPDEFNDRYTDVFSLPSEKIEEALKARKQEFKISEERRLAYVAFTRAKERLTLCYPRTYGESPGAPSRFVVEACYDENGKLSRDVEYIEDQAETIAEIIIDSDDLDRKKDEVKGLLISSLDAEPELALYNLLLYQRLCGRPPRLSCPEAAMAEEEAAAILMDIGSGLPQGLEFDPRKIRLSQTALKVYEECPKKYELSILMNMPSRQDKSEGNDPAGFGQYIHRVLELAVTQKISSKDQLTTIADEVATQPEYARIDAVRASGILDVFWERNKNSIHNSIAAEYRFSFELGGFYFTGKIDRIDLIDGGNDGDAEIIDYKTGRGSSTDSIDRQIAMYMLALQRDPVLMEKGLVPRRARLELLEAEQPRTFELSEDGAKIIDAVDRHRSIDLKAAKTSILKTAQKIAYDYEHGFEAVEECGSVWFTRNCPYKMYCPRWG
ncbi:MAG TPA: PD-(D/E)XK nuclease family protein, partial [Methanocella sp.]|nr:PD-(D/E)XK nuclease family protein [Methanocella sp.]